MLSTRAKKKFQNMTFVLRNSTNKLFACYQPDPKNKQFQIVTFVKTNSKYNFCIQA